MKGETAKGENAIHFYSCARLTSLVPCSIGILRKHVIHASLTASSLGTQISTVRAEGCKINELTYLM